MVIIVLIAQHSQKYKIRENNIVLYEREGSDIRVLSFLILNMARNFANAGGEQSEIHI